MGSDVRPEHIYVLVTEKSIYLYRFNQVSFKESHT